MNHNFKQIHQAKKLEESVKRLCSFDRRAAHKIGTEETLHYLSGELEQAQLKANLHRADMIAASQIREGIKSSIARHGNFSPRKLKELKAKTAILEPSGALDIVNLFTRIGDPRGKKIIIGAHYDMDLFLEKGAGADDNASGVATVLQLAKNLKTKEKELAEAGLCIEIVFFGAEENPFHLRGSHNYARQFTSVRNSTEVALMLNLDMVGFFDDNRDLDIRLGDCKYGRDNPFGIFLNKLKRTLPQKENYYVINSFRHKEKKYAEELLSAMRNQSLVVEHLYPQRLSYIPEDEVRYQKYEFNSGTSDHNSFRYFSFPTIAIDANPFRNKNYHTQADVPETLDYNRMSKLTDSLEQFLLGLTQKKDPSNWSLFAEIDCHANSVGSQ